MRFHVGEGIKVRSGFRGVEARGRRSMWLLRLLLLLGFFVPEVGLVGALAGVVPCFDE